MVNVSGSIATYGWYLLPWFMDNDAKYCLEAPTNIRSTQCVSHDTKGNISVIKETVLTASNWSWYIVIWDRRLWNASLPCLYVDKAEWLPPKMRAGGNLWEMIHSATKNWCAPHEKESVAIHTSCLQKERPHLEMRYELSLKERWSEKTRLITLSCR